MITNENVWLTDTKILNIGEENDDSSFYRLNLCLKFDTVISPLLYINGVANDYLALSRFAYLNWISHLRRFA